MCTTYGVTSRHPVSKEAPKDYRVEKKRFPRKGQKDTIIYNVNDD